ncbi:MAG: hypothetical protein CMJ39_05025 [Phycisphaerae bacterium]|nr:hypothetical protein [Phycisphaerae bacterium]|tara:strand:- start:1581 stop:2918 length:1338 start_codon:yes stop_codon:yes gene_type:complete
MRFVVTLMIACLVILAGHAPVQAQDGAAEARQSVRLKTGHTWRGRIGDIVEVHWKRGASRPSLTGRVEAIDRLYLKVLAEGAEAPQVILVDYITSLKTLERRDVDGGAQASDQDSTPEPKKETAKQPAAASEDQPKTEEQKKSGKDGTGIFILPLSGTVGIEFRPEEIEKITAQADARGDGQVIVLEIDSGGGLVAEGLIIKEAIDEARKRHTLVAWIDHAISGASWTALCCDLIIFKQHGHTGGITIMRGNTMLTNPAEVEQWIKTIEDLLIEHNRPKHWGRPFVVHDTYLSATKDPDTGQVNWYPDQSGEKMFSVPGKNLMFNAPEAEEYGFSYGTANTPEQLAEILQLKEWELDGTGQEMHDERYELKERFMAAMQKDQYKLSTLGNSVADINKRIKIFQSWLGWWRKVPNQCRMNGVPPKEQIKKMIDDQKYLLRRMSGGG